MGEGHDSGRQFICRNGHHVWTYDGEVPARCLVRLRGDLIMECGQPVASEVVPLVDDVRCDECMEPVHVPSYLAGWNDAKAGRQYGEGRAHSGSGEVDR